MVVYEVAITLPNVITITEQMSFGAIVINDWGYNPPFCGLLSTEGDDTYGCGEIHWDFPGAGVVRWALFSYEYLYIVDIAFCLALQTTGVSEEPTHSPLLRKNFPNPFNPATTIRFDLARPGPVELEIYDVAGRIVAGLLDRTMAAGNHQLVWRGRDERGHDVPSGVFFSVLKADGFAGTRKMVLLR